MPRYAKPPTKKVQQAARARLDELPKLSESMLQFAKPLLDQLPDPPSIEDMRQVMMIVTAVWNLPLYEQRKSPNAASYRATLNTMMARLPPEIAKIISTMLHTRLTTYAHDPRLGFADVVEEAPGRAKIVATAALTDL